MYLCPTEYPPTAFKTCLQLMAEICKYSEIDLSALMLKWDISLGYFGQTNLIASNFKKKIKISLSWVKKTVATGEKCNQ